MGREVKRVALDFEWPLNEVWEGYAPVTTRPCPAGPDCVNGHTVAGALVERIVALLLLVGSDARERPPGYQGIVPHPWLQHVPCGPRMPFKVGPDGAEFSAGLAGRAPSFLGHDSSDTWAARRRVVEAAGLDPATWGICPICNGAAVNPDDAHFLEEDHSYDPPAGDGWQLWETTSEGSPISPVFASADELATWAAEHATTFGDSRASREAWLAMIHDEDQMFVGSTLIVTVPREGCY